MNKYTKKIMFWKDIQCDKADSNNFITIFASVASY